MPTLTAARLPSPAATCNGVRFSKSARVLQRIYDATEDAIICMGKTNCMHSLVSNVFVYVLLLEAKAMYAHRHASYSSRWRLLCLHQATSLDACAADRYHHMCNQQLLCIPTCCIGVCIAHQQAPQEGHISPEHSATQLPSLGSGNKQAHSTGQFIAAAAAGSCCCCCCCCCWLLLLLLLAAAVAAALH